MTIHKCDNCGKTMSVWLSVTTRVDSVDPMTNVANLVKCIGTREYCPACYIKGMPIVRMEGDLNETKSE